MRPIEPHQPFVKQFESPVAIPPWWRSREAQIQGVFEEIRGGTVLKLAGSAGGRLVRAVVYGEDEPQLRGTANFNSALGSGDERAYWRRDQRQRPVLVLLGGMHGHEVEGMMACVSVIQLMERGTDLAGREQAALVQKLKKLRLIVIPLANPDGRVRVPYDGFVRLPGAEMTRVGQGTRRDGSSYGWRGCKAVHPMRGDVGSLGGYFDDAGINLAHDEFFDPMSPVTAAVLRLVRDEAPDMLINLHSYTAAPGVLPIHYVPMRTKQRIADFVTMFYSRMEQAGLPHAHVPAVAPDGTDDKTPPPFNIVSACFHAGAALPFTFECAHGLDNGPANFGYEQILQTHHVLFETSADWLMRK